MRKLTEKQIKHTAIEIQDACNIIAVSIFLADALRSLSRQGLGSKELNCHPAVILTVSKLDSLTGRLGQHTWEEFSKAYDTCKEVS